MLDLLLCIAAIQSAAPQEPANPQEPIAPHLQAVPEQLTALVTVNDMPGLLLQGRENSWYRYFLDPELAQLRSWFDPHQAAEGEWQHGHERQSLHSLADSLEALTVFFAPTSESPVGALGVVLHAHEAHQPLSDQVQRFHARLAHQEEPALETWHDTTLRIYNATDSADGEDVPATVVCAEFGELFLFVMAEVANADRDFVIQLAKESIDRSMDLESASILTNERFLEARSSSPAPLPTGRGHHIEGFVDVSSLARLIPKDRKAEPIIAAVVRSLSSIPWVYASTTLGKGEEMDSQFGFRCDRSTLLGRLLGLAEPAPEDMLALLPPDSATISMGAFDMNGLVDMLLEGVDKYAPAGSAQKLRATLTFVQAQFGLDPVDDLLRSFTGRFAVFQRYDPDRPIADSSDPLTFSMIETLVLDLNDGEEFAEYLLEVLSIVGVEANLEIDEYEDVDIYSLPDGPPISWTITDEFIAVSGRRDDLEHLIRASRSKQPSVQDGERMALALEQTHGTTLFSVSDTAAVLKAMGEAFDMVSTVSSATPRLMEMSETFGAFGSAGILAPDLVDKYVSGLMYSSWSVEDSRVWLRSWGR
ncbi:MAG: hypothetical protein ACI8QZ_002765 [Chlamydiales bacterium]|jgi:hypothetical protein